MDNCVTCGSKDIVQEETSDGKFLATYCRDCGETHFDTL